MWCILFSSVFVTVGFFAICVSQQANAGVGVERSFVHGEMGQGGGDTVLFLSSCCRRRRRR